MKTRLVLTPHTEIPGAHTIELWYGDQFIGTVVGADWPGIRVISKHSLSAFPAKGFPEVMEVCIDPNRTEGR